MEQSLMTILVGSSKTRMLVEIQKIKTTLTMFQIEMRSLSNIRTGVLSVIF